MLQSQYGSSKHIQSQDDAHLVPQENLLSQYLSGISSVQREMCPQPPTYEQANESAIPYEKENFQGSSLNISDLIQSKFVQGESMAGAKKAHGTRCGVL